MSQQEQTEIKTLEKLDSEIKAPPSKANTLRALFLAALAEGTSAIKNSLFGEDQILTINALKELGVKIEKENENLKITGVNGKFISSGNPLFLGNSGMATRAFTVLGSLADKDIIIDGDERMRTGRPIQDLIDAIKPLGIEAESTNRNGCPPITVKARSFEGGSTTLKGDKSSQYFTAILLFAPFAKKEVVINTAVKLYSKPYIDITLKMMKKFGVDVINDNYEKFTVSPGQKYTAQEYIIGGDYSSASFFFAAAAITQGRIKITNLIQQSTQGDKIFVDYLEMMGCEVNRGDGWIEIIGKPLKSIKVDMGNYPDIVVPLAVVSAFAKGTSEFTNIEHLKYKESDRLVAPVTELRKMGVNATATNNSIIVEGAEEGEIKGAEIDTYNDHRMAMSFAVAGLKVPGMKINNPCVVKKSFPDFWELFNGLYSS